MAVPRRTEGGVKRSTVGRVLDPFGTGRRPDRTGVVNLTPLCSTVEGFGLRPLPLGFHLWTQECDCGTPGL